MIASTEGFVAVSTAYGIAKLGLNLITTDAAWAGGKTVPTIVQAPGLVKGSAVKGQRCLDQPSAFS